MLQLIHALVEHTEPLSGLASPRHPGRFNETLIRLRRIVRPGSLIYLISDFYDLDDDSAKHLLRLRQHNDLMAIQVVDPVELTPPPPGRYGITDGRHYGVLDTRSRRGRQDYSSYFQQHHQTLHQIMRSHAIPLLQLQTSDQVISALQNQFGNRTRAYPLPVAAA